MTRQTVSIANAHDGVALTQDDAEELAAMISDRAMRNDRGWDEVIAILRGKRRDGSEPGDDA